MGGIKRDAVDTLKAIRALAANEILAMSDEEILQDANAYGISPKEIGSTMRAKAIEIIAISRKQRLKAARKQLDIEKSTSASKRSLSQIGIDEKKKKILDFFTSNQEFSLAFRNGERQSESDWESLWEDLLKVGLIKDNESQD